MAKRVYFLVHGGAVQGVFFRRYTKMKAEEYNLTGWVRNIPDNKVDGEAQGDEKDVARLLEYVKEGPKHAHVVKLETVDRDLVDGEQGFEVRR